MNLFHPAEPGAALTRCTGLDRAAFGAAYWSQQPLLSQHPSGFEDLLSAADIDELVAERGIRSPFFRMVRDGQSITGTTRLATAGNRRINDLVDAEAVRSRYTDGSTLVLQSLHRIHPPLVRFCRALAAELGHPTQCNAYVTPPGSRGFAAHHDTHDVFVLQVDGHKRWQVYAPVIKLPLSSQPSTLTSTATSTVTSGDAPPVPDGKSPVLSVLLGPGDALYLPRGYIHAAETNDNRSIHLTVGVLAATGYDVLKDVLTLAADELAFRQALPLGAPDDQLVPVADIVAQAAAWLTSLSAAQLHEAVRARVSNVAGPEPLGMLATEDLMRRLDKDTLVGPRAGVAAALKDSAKPGRVLLQLRDRTLDLPEYVATAVQALLAGPRLVGELDLAVDDSIVLVRRLLREGILTGH